MKKALVCLCLFASLIHLPAGAQTKKVTYYYADPQGSILAETDDGGEVTKRYDYKPYGSGTIDPAEDGPGYTNHVTDIDTGLVYMQARYQDPVPGRFLSPDPVKPSSGDVFSFNRYAYANNNPTTNVDPDGRTVT
jgi:RHS repeat-associated protein